jgi:hypothetical protein
VCFLPFFDAALGLEQAAGARLLCAHTRHTAFHQRQRQPVSWWLVAWGGVTNNLCPAPPPPSDGRANACDAENLGAVRRDLSGNPRPGRIWKAVVRPQVTDCRRTPILPSEEVPRSRDRMCFVASVHKGYEPLPAVCSKFAPPDLATKWFSAGPSPKQVSRRSNSRLMDGYQRLVQESLLHHVRHVPHVCSH